MNEENIITLNDEDGNEIKFEFLDLISYRQKDYVVMLPLPVISPPLNRHPPSHIFHLTLSDQNGDDGGFVVQELTVEEREKLPFP